MPGKPGNGLKGLPRRKRAATGSMEHARSSIQRHIGTGSHLLQDPGGRPSLLRTTTCRVISTRARRKHRRVAEHGHNGGRVVSIAAQMDRTTAHFLKKS